MNEYISKDKALKLLRMQLLEHESNIDKEDYIKQCESRAVINALDDAIYNIKTIRSTNVQPVKQGHWIVKGQEIYCSECNTESSYNAFGASQFTHFCPKCGSKMKLDIMPKEV